MRIKSDLLFFPMLQSPTAPILKSNRPCSNAFYKTADFKQTNELVHLQLVQPINEIMNDIYCNFDWN